MSLSVGSRFGHYEVIAPLGVGGMGEVYRASDTKLKRDVAVKILPSSVALDRERLARFQREAEVLASLNHPNIAHLYGLEESDGVRALIMELVEGPTLADRIGRGPLDSDEALVIARQIAEGLEAAHEQNIVHRDLKPANVVLRPDGTVKVLDFGLAKAVEPLAGAASDIAQSPTITSPAMTELGVILGTAAYMSPEQARGKAADRRADIWAFGCVLYEMLTGRRAFDDEDVALTLSKVLQREPDYDLLPQTVPSHVRVALRLCLQKDLRHRARAIGDIRLALDRAFESTAPVNAIAPAGGSWRRAGLAAAAGLALIAGTGAAVWLATRPDPPRVAEVLLAPQTGPAALSFMPGGVSMTMTADGSRVIYVGNNGTQLFVRKLETLQPEAIFTGTPRQPFVSPDGEWIGFVDASRILKKIRISGGPAVPLVTLDGELRGATWGPEDTIILATTSPVTGLQRLKAADGTLSTITKPASSNGEYDHLWPEFLPDGRAVLFTITAAAELDTITATGSETAQVAVRDLQTDVTTVLLPGATHARYAPTGHLIFAAGGEIRAIPFDPASRKASGTATTVIRGVASNRWGWLNSAVGRNNTLAYIASGEAPPVKTMPVWVGRDGRETAVGPEPRGFVMPRLSPDDSQIAFFVADEGLDIWVWNIAARTLKPIWRARAADAFPVWTLDGRIIFSSEREGIRNLFWGAADGTGTLSALVKSPNVLNASALTPDGSKLIYTEVSRVTNEDVMEVDLTAPHRIRALLQSQSSERNGVVSPNSRWLAYEANLSNQFQVYVRAYPNTDSKEHQVSTAGGTSPLWTRDGKGLIYATPQVPQGTLMRVDVTEGPTWTASAPYRAVPDGYVTQRRGGTPTRVYDIARDGRLLMLKLLPGEESESPPALVLVQNWSQGSRK